MKKIILVISVIVILLAIVFVGVSYYQAKKFVSILKFDSQDAQNELRVISAGNCAGWPALKNKAERGLFIEKLSCMNPLTMKILLSKTVNESGYDFKYICSHINESETNERAMIQRVQDFCDKLAK